MEEKLLFLSIVLVLIVWFVFGFITFLIEARRTQEYETFDKKTQLDCISLTCLGLLAFVMEMFIIISELFVNWMNKLLKKISRQ